MKGLTCEKCNTHLKDFKINNINMNCNCPGDDKLYDICSGIYICIIKKRASFIQICYKNIQIDFSEENFELYCNFKLIIKDKHNLKFSKNLINNIKKQINLLNKLQTNLLFL